MINSGIFNQLRAEHSEFAQLGRSIEAMMRTAPVQLDRRKLLALVQEFKSKLTSHSLLEDNELYPEIRKLMGRSALLTETYMSHLENEHESIDGHLKKLLEQVSAKKLMPGWGQTFAIFSVGLRSHMRREEEELFPEAERLLGT